MGNYEFDFNDAGPYGSAVRLLSTSAPEGRVVLDVGCGAGAVAGAGIHSPSGFAELKA